MSQKSDDDLLTAGLVPPSEPAAQRAKPIFDRLVGEMRSGRAVSPTPTAAPSGDTSRQFGGGRRYDVALSMVADLAPAATASAAPPRPALQVTAAAPAALLGDDEVTQVAPVDSSAEPTVIGVRPEDVHLDTVSRTPVRRPPAGAPTVRQAIKRPPRSFASAEQMLQQTAESALLRTESDGAMAFDITIRDDVFADLACTISVNNGRAVAIFRVRDDSARRLLEAELGRLRAGLEERGLRVEEIKVVQE